MSWLHNLIGKQAAEDSIHKAYCDAIDRLHKLLKKNGVHRAGLAISTNFKGKDYSVRIYGDNAIHTVTVTCTSEDRAYTPWGCGAVETTEVLENLLASA